MVTELGTIARSQVRHRPIHPTRTGATPITPRSSAHPSRVLKRYRSQQQYDDVLIDELTRQQPAPDTDQDCEIAPSTRTGYRQQTKIQPSPDGSRFHPRNWHPLVWIGLTLLVLLCLYWLATGGLAWWNNTLVNPAKYGPTQGGIAVGVFDSQAQASKLIAVNNNGRVEIIMLHANDPKKSEILVGPDLVALSFPDAVHAHVDLVVGDFDHDGNLDVQVTIVSTVYDKPLFPYAQQYILYGDGQGHLKQRQQ